MSSSNRPAKISLPSMVQYLRESQRMIDIYFDFQSRQIIDLKTHLPIGDFNKIRVGTGKGKVFIAPLALVTIRARLEEADYGASSDKTVKDALVMCYDDMLADHQPFPTVLPDWLTGGAAS